VSEFLVVYDYGTGGVWGFARAATEADVVQAFPELIVFHEKPEWMTQEEEQSIRSESSFIVGDQTSYPEWLNALVDGR
jgi:hypothetical protein